MLIRKEDRAELPSESHQDPKGLGVIQNARRQRFRQNGYVRTEEGEARVWDEEGDEEKQGGWRRNSNKHNKHNILLVPQAWAEKQHFQNGVR